MFLKNTGESVVAAKSLKKNDEVFSISLDLILSYQHAKDVLGNYDITYGNFSQTEYDRGYFSFYVATEMSKGKNSFYFPYFNVLPKQVGTIYNDWSENEIKELQSEFLQNFIINQRETLASMYHHTFAPIFLHRFPKVNFTLFVWAHDIVLTRGFNSFILNSTTSPGTVLIPWADTLNHKNGKDTLEVKLENGAIRGFISSSSSKTTKRGKQLFYFYGIRSNIRLLFNYGFVLKRNIFDKVEVLDRMTIATYSAGHYRQLLSNLLDYFNKNNNLEASLESCIDYFVNVMENKFPTTLDYDLNLIKRKKKNLSKAIEFAIYFRIGQKRAFHVPLNVCQSFKVVLFTKNYYYYIKQK